MMSSESGGGYSRSWGVLMRPVVCDLLQMLVGRVSVVWQSLAVLAWVLSVSEVLMTSVDLWTESLDY